MRAAARGAKAVGAKLLLADRPIAISTQRISNSEPPTSACPADRQSRC